MPFVLLFASEFLLSHSFLSTGCTAYRVSLCETTFAIVRAPSAFYDHYLNCKSIVLYCALGRSVGLVYCTCTLYSVHSVHCVCSRKNMYTYLPELPFAIVLMLIHYYYIRCSVTKRKQQTSVLCFVDCRHLCQLPSTDRHPLRKFISI